MSHYAVLTTTSLDICDGCYGTIVTSTPLDTAVTKDTAIQVCYITLLISFPCFTCMVISNQLLHHCDHMILVLGRKVYSWNIVLPLATSLSQVLGKGKRLGERPLLNMPPWKRARNVSNVQSPVMSSAKLLYLCNCIFHFLFTYFLYLCRIQVFGKISSSRQTKDYG